MEINESKERIDIKKLYFLKHYKRSIQLNQKEFKINCKSYLIFTKFCGHTTPYLANFNKLFLKIGEYV